jgi:hypothetical protein
MLAMAVDNPQLELKDLAHDMAEWARDNMHFLGAAAVALVQVINKDTGEVSMDRATYATRLTSDPDPVNRGVEDRGTNYAAMADGKVDARLRRELFPDPSNIARRGEDPADGDAAAWLSSSLLIITAYSGCPKPAEDRVVANYGLNQYHQRTLNG